MSELIPGTYRELEIKRITSHGAFLNYSKDAASDDVLLPGQQIPEGAAPGTIVKVFIYRDSKDRLISTVRKPKLAMGDFGWLTVIDTSKIGAFLDWGLEKDLFLPFDEQNRKIHKGDKLFVGVKLDNKNRLCATMRIHDLLETNHSYSLNARVDAVVYSLNDRMGAFAAVDGKYYGLIPRKEFTGRLKVGDRIKARVNQIRRDGKLVLSIRKKAYGEIDSDSAKIIDRLIQNDGFLPYDDKTDPLIIKGRFGFSKAAFKRALGRLLKQKRIKFKDDGISLIDKD